MKINAKWHSARLRQEMQVVRWGVSGQPVLLFPTAGGDAEESERFLMLKVLDPLLAAGRIKVYACDSVGGRALIDRKVQPAQKAAIQRQFLQFVRHELVPAIHADCQTQGIPIWAAGASIGAYNAVTAVTSFPDVFTRAIAMSGTYNVNRFLDGFHNDDVHAISPLLHLRYLQPDSEHLQRLRQTFVLMPTGEGKWEDPAESWQIASLLGKLGVPNRVDLWGKSYDHDWVTWREMLPKYLEEWTRPDTVG
jgi:esterase/lipase superfamily enzyme